MERNLTLLVFVLVVYGGLMLVSGLASWWFFRDHRADMEEPLQFHIPVSVLLTLNAVVVGLILVIMAYLQVGESIGITHARLNDFLVIFIGLPIFLWVAWHEALEPILSTLREWAREARDDHSSGEHSA